ncbi:NUMOD4 domain-containing protein [Pseudomonas knackmussii]|uniref:NUMOD4 domain-containing protein n=1 Tax=Pseudomonas knackmussii TaxID=65741 RepID=UPI003F4A8456
MSKEQSKHPEQAEGVQGERELFENDPHFKGMNFNRFPERPEFYESPYAGGAWDGWRHGRSALAQQSPKCAHGDWTACALCDALPATQEKPSPALELERPEVVAFLMKPDTYEPYLSFRRDYSCDHVEPLMTVAQYDRIVGALRAEVERERYQGHLHLNRARVAEQERDAAQAKLAAMEAELADAYANAEREELRANGYSERLAAMEQQEPAEEWRPVVGFEGHYSVSSLGRLRSDKTGKYLSLNSLMASGYVKASLHKDGVREQTSVHRVVAKAFLDNPEGLYEVNHLNGDKTDNRVINLAWCSRSENVDHGYYQLGHLVHPVKAIPVEGNGPTLIFSSIEQAVANGFTSRNIYDCLAEGYRVHAGHHWQSMRNDPVAQAGQVPDIDTLVNRFLSWQLPDEVCADPCASMPGYAYRTGTNLLTAEQARTMFVHVLAAAPQPEKGE